MNADGSRHAFTVIAAAALLACSTGGDPSSSETISSSSGALRIRVRYSPDPPARGTGAAEFTIVRASDDAPVDGLSLDVKPWMPAMNHGAGALPTVAPLGEGRYAIGNLDLYMAGRWELQTSIGGEASTSGSATDYVAPAFDVP